MESDLEQNRSTQAEVRPVSRLLRFGLASIAALVIVGRLEPRPGQLGRVIRIDPGLL